MIHFIRHLAVFIAFTLSLAVFAPHPVLANPMDPIADELKSAEAAHKGANMPDNVLLENQPNPPCPPDIQVRLETAAALSQKIYQGEQKDQSDQGVVKAEDATCFGSVATNVVKKVTKVWNDACKGGGGSFGSMVKCLGMKLMEDSLKTLNEDIIKNAKKQACQIVKDVVDRQLNQCIQLGLHIKFQTPQFKGLNACLIKLRAVGNLNVNLNSFDPTKILDWQKSTEFGSPMWEQFNAKCGATTVSDLPTALLTKDCWTKVIGRTLPAVQSCLGLDTTIVAAIAKAQAEGTTKTALLPLLTATKDADGNLTWMFKPSEPNTSAELACYGFTQDNSVCSADPADPNNVDNCPVVEVGNYCCDPSKQTCADAPDLPICQGVCCDKTRNDCAKLNPAVAECVSNASCIGSMEKVFAVGADGSKTDTGQTAADILLNSAEKSVWTKLKHVVKPDAEVAGKACCATPWCNLCPQDIMIEDMRLQGKTRFPDGVYATSGIILAEGTSPPAGNAKSVLGTTCGTGRIKISPAEVIQFIFENRPGDKFAEGSIGYLRDQKNNARNRQTKDILTGIKDLFSGSGISFGEFTLDETIQAYQDSMAALGMGEGKMVYQPLYAQGLPVNYAKVLKDGETRDVPLCSALDFCPIEIDVDANGNPILKGSGTTGGGTGTGGTGGVQCGTSSDGCKAQCGTDNACYSRCCGTTTGGGGTGSGTGGTGGGTVTGGTTVQQCQNACTGTDAQEIACRRACAAGATTGGTTTGGGDNTTGGGGTGGGGNKVEDPNATTNTGNSAVVVNPTTQAPITEKITETLKNLF